MFCFGILKIFGGNRKKRKIGKSSKNWAPTLQCREPTSLRRPTPRRGMPRCGEAEVPKWHPWVRHGVATVHRGQNFEFLFRKSSFCTPIV